MAYNSSYALANRMGSFKEPNMADLIKDGKRGGKELDQESAKTDGMCKGGETGIGSAPDQLSLGKRGGKEFAVEDVIVSHFSQ